MSTTEYDNKEFEVSLDAAPKLGERTITHKDASGESVTSTYLADYEYRFKSLGLVYTPASEDGRATIGIVKNDENTLGGNWLQSKLSNINERLGEAYSSEPSDRVLEKIADDIILYYSANGTSLSPAPHDVTLDKDVLISDLRDFYSKSYNPDHSWSWRNEESEQSLEVLQDYLYQQELESASQILNTFQQQFGSEVSLQASAGVTPEEPSNDDVDKSVLDSVVAEHTGITEDLSDDGDGKYILVAEDRSQVSYGDDVGDMQVVRSIADDGSIDGVSVSNLTDDTAQAVPKFEKEPSGQSVKTGKSGKPKPTIDKDYDIPLLEPFLRNFIRFAKNGNYRLWLVPVLSQGIKGISAGIENLRQALSDPKNHGEYIKDSRVRPQDYLEAPTVTDGLEAKLASLGLSKQILEERGQLENLLSFKPTDLLPVHIKTGDIDIRTEGRLTLRTQPDGSESISVRCVRKELNLEAPYMCCSFTDQDKESLLETGHLGRVAQLKGADGREFSAYISVDEDTNTLVYVPTARVYIPQTISGVDLSPDQRATLRAGKPLAFSGVSAKGKEYTATIQVDACKRAMSFTFPTNEMKQVLGTRRADGVPTMISGQVLTKEAQNKLAKGETLYLEGLKNSRTKKSFNSYVSYDASTQKVRYSKYDPTDLTKQAQKREVRLAPNDKDAPKQKQSREQSKGRKV
ncbi:DUF3945 domain-containing protein [Porphyromonas uenonis]